MSILQMDSPDGINLFKQMIIEICQKEIQKAAFNKMVTCKVVSADNVAKTCVIELLSDGTQVTAKNRTGENLATNDLCQLLLINSSTSNFAVTIKN
jgi:hypothetical protein